ncbi:MAG: hypothetical protein ABWY93_06370 [Mycobacterium sp.]
MAGALPSFVVAELLGISHDDGRRLYELTEIMNTGLMDESVHQAQLQMFEYAAELAARKRAEPGDDIASSLLAAEVDGQRLTDLEFNLFFLLLINTGGRAVTAADRDRGAVALRHPGDGIHPHCHPRHRGARGAAAPG